jgi:small-conductance mechanosensitive channel
MTIILRILALAISLIVLGSAASYAQAPTAAPAGMTQQQFDSLVDAISKSVADKLKAEGVHAPAPAPEPASKAKSGKGAPAPPPHIIRTPPKQGPGEFAIFLQNFGKALAAVPAAGAQFATLVSELHRRPEGGLGAGAFIVVLGLIGAAAVTAERILRGALGRVRQHLATQTGAEHGLRSLASLGALWALDALGLLAVWLICNAAGAWFSGGTPQDTFAEAVLAGIFAWRLYMLVVRIVLQPEMEQARLCAVDNGNARMAYRRIAAVTLLLIVVRILGRVLFAMGAAPEAFAAFQIFGVTLTVAGLLWIVFGSKVAARQWLEGLGKVSRIAGAIGRHWPVVATTFFVVLGATQIYSAVSGRLQVGSAMVLTLGLVIGFLVFETLLQAFVRRLDSQLQGATPASDRPKLPDVAARCVRVAVFIFVAVAIAQVWAVEVLGLASPDEWDQITRSSRTAGVTLFLAYVLWEFIKYATDPYMARKPKDAAAAILEGDAAATPVSRIGTMMPLLRATVATLIVFIAVMIALEDFGINVMPLLAGASIFGIAISFGSQTLVRDIVSGIFYLTDDAFRVGEYIDCGRAKGTVEGFTLRSIKLRHQNGQVHTIPFGQLGQITNFSRDWITVKFNLRFARNTDIEKLRKTAKKIGQEMLEVPEIKSEILAPFKMQGVADIVDNALLVRFKFTARPGNPAMIQREAVKRMFNTLPGLGLEFAKEGAAVIVHAAPTMTEGEPAAAAATARTGGTPTPATA